MNRSLTLACSMLLITCILTTVRAGDAPALSDLDRLAKLIKPAASESKWLSIPWETNLWQARQRAAKEGKPILLWEMDGNPLGCT